jgi:ribonuclease Z
VDPFDLDTAMSAGASLAVLWAGLTVTSLAAAPPLPAQDTTFRVTLLGTGTPRPALDRFGPSILVEAGSQKLLFDVGRGATQRLAQIGVPFSALSGVFLTHLHSDHVVGLPDLWLTGWLLANRTLPLPVRGPRGSLALTTHLEAAFAFDVQIRVADDHAPASGGHLSGIELAAGSVYTQDGVTVTAFEVDHEPVTPAFGYRIDYRGHSVVLSGDTRPSERLVAMAQGASLLIHEVALATDSDLAASPLSRGIIAHHTTPAQAALLFQRIRPALAVYSHIVLRPGATSDQLIPLTRTGYAGPLVVGADLMRFTIGDSIRVTSALARPD